MISFVSTIRLIPFQWLASVHKTYSTMSLLHIPILSSSIPALNYVDLPEGLGDLPLPSTKEANAAWSNVAPLLNYYDIWLYESYEFQNNPPAPEKDPLDPFHPQDDENFIVFPKCLKALRRSLWPHNVGVRSIHNFPFPLMII